MNREELKNILPHREPMLLLDEAHLEEDGAAVGTYTVKGDEFFLKGHFPEEPVVPGVILCEIMAQTCAALFKRSQTPMYAGLDNVRFRMPVRPGDTVRFVCRIIKSRGAFYFARGEGFVGEKMCIKGEFSFAVSG